MRPIKIIKRLAIAALLIVAYPAWAVTVGMQACGGGADEHTEADICSGNRDCCPPVVQNATGGPLDSSTSSQASCGTTVAAGTMYVCLTTSDSTPATFSADPSDSTGCAIHTSQAVNALTVTFTGLSTTGETDYYVSCGQEFDKRGTYITDRSPKFTTNAASGSGLTGAGKFVCDNDSGNTSEGDGSNGNNGTAMSSAWETLANASNLADGDNVYGCEGGTWADIQWEIDWAGSSGDPVEIGCYFDEGDDDGEPVECSSF